MSSYSLSSRAYTKIALHAAKYPASTLLGLLIGKASPSSPQNVVIEDVVPLLHKWTTLSPITEAGSALVSIEQIVSTPCNWSFALTSLV